MVFIRSYCYIYDTHPDFFVTPICVYHTRYYTCITFYDMIPASNRPGAIDFFQNRNTKTRYDISEFRTGVSIFRFWMKDFKIRRRFSFPVLQVNSSLPFTIRKVSYTRYEILFHLRAWGGERPLILGALSQNLKNKAPVRNSPLYIRTFWRIWSSLAF